MEMSYQNRLQFQVEPSVMEDSWPTLPQMQNISGESLMFVAENKEDSLNSSITAILVFVLVTATSKLYLQKGKKKINLPGPKPYPIIGNAHLLAGDSSKLIYKISELLDEYNGLMALWIGPKLHVFVSEPEHLETFCNHPKLQDKSAHYHFVKPLLGESIFTANGATWKQGRKLMLPPLRPSFIKNMMPNFNDHTLSMIDRIHDEEGKGSFDVFPYLRDCAYAMIFEAVMGRRIESVTTSESSLRDTEEIMDLMYQRALKLWLQWDPLYFLLPVGRRFKAGVENINSHNTEQIVRTMNHLGGLERKRSEGEILVEHLLNKIGTSESGIQAIREHTSTMLVTGYDTTAGTMGFVLMMLGMHQDVQQAAYEEVVGFQSEGEELTADTLTKMQYLERVIKETLRLFPVGPILFREASDDVKIGEFLVPKGASVACVMLRTHRNPKIYPNPLKFNPDNFLPERVQRRHPYSYIPFSAGSRGCIGTKYGMMSMKVIVSQLLVNYKILCDTKMEDIRLKPEITMKVDGGFKIRLQKRQH